MVGTTLEIVVVVVMLVRGLYRKLPYFFAYAAFDVITTIVLSALQKHHPAVFFYGYWYGEVVSWVLALAVIYEIYASLLKDYAALQKLGAFLFWLMGAVLVLVALWAAFNSPGSDTFRFVRAVLNLERSMRIVQAGLLVALFIFASFFGLSWKNYLFGIALGLALYVCSDLAVVAIRAYGGKMQHFSFTLLKPATYNLGALVWTIYVLKSWRPADLRALPRTELAAWNDALQDLLHR
ncbi:MAG TPA: hypothetical protein VK738_11600 [Terriglobales bacterium]|nr:hypothetical protein [Terriglobales bacterium]